MRTLGHHGGPIMSVLAVGSLSLGLWRAPAPVLLLLVGAIAVVWTAMRRHDHSLCERCARAMPDCPSEDAIRYRHRLSAIHLVSQPLAACSYLLAVLLSGMVAGTPGTAVAAATIVYLFLAQRTHRRLQPWCPKCANGGTARSTNTFPPHLSPAR